jgi:hypothetical protein
MSFTTENCVCVEGDVCVRILQIFSEVKGPKGNEIQ